MPRPLRQAIKLRSLDAVAKFLPLTRREEIHGAGIIGKTLWSWITPQELGKHSHVECERLDTCHLDLPAREAFLTIDMGSQPIRQPEKHLRLIKDMLA